MRHLETRQNHITCRKEYTAKSVGCDMEQWETNAINTQQAMWQRENQWETRQGKIRGNETGEANGT